MVFATENVRSLTHYPAKPSTVSWAQAVPTVSPFRGLFRLACLKRIKRTVMDIEKIVTELEKGRDRRHRVFASLEGNRLAEGCENKSAPTAARKLEVQAGAARRIY